MRNFVLVRWGRYLYFDRLTESGRAFFWIGLMANAASLGTFGIKVYFVWCVLISLLLISIPAARLARARLELSYQLPQRASAGSQLEVPVEVVNLGKRSASDVLLRFHHLPAPLAGEPQPLPVLASGEETLRQLTLDLKRRGHYTLPGIRQEGYFPFGVWRDLVVHGQESALLVTPWFQPLVELDVPVGRRYQPGGIALSSNVGDSTEFLGTREYRYGDSVRNIHWRSWGRLGKPVVKEFQEEYFCRIALVLDTFVPADSGEEFRDTFEASLSMAAAVADWLSDGEYVIDLFAAGPELYSLQAGRNIAHLENVLDVLACLEPCREPPFETIAPVLLENMANTTTVILVLLDWDQQREGLVRVLRDHGPAIKTILVRDREPTLDPSAAEELLGPVVRLEPEDVWKGVDRC